MDRENQLQLFKDFIINCTANANSLKNYIDFKRINECLQQLFPERKDVSILDFDDPIAFEKVVNELEGLKTYIDFNAKGKNQYSTTVSWYQRFLNAKHLFSKQKKAVLRINESLGLPLQQIFYGAPGTGKSHEIKKLTKGKSVIRTTFHPDSDYSTFVGAYKPSMEKAEVRVVPVVVNNGISLDQNNGTYKEDKIVYKFVKQAFLKAYLSAWKKMLDYGQWTQTTTAITMAGQPVSPYWQTNNVGTNSSFEYISLNGVTLDQNALDLLNKVDNFDFPFDGIQNFGELHGRLKSGVVVTDYPTEEQKKHRYKKITLNAKQIRELYERFPKAHGSELDAVVYLLGRISEKLRLDRGQLKDYTGEDVSIDLDDIYSLLGLYDSTTKTVYLFKNNIEATIGDFNTLLCATYIHEMFHAYYDSCGQYIPEIEEPVVECNTLCFLELFNKDYLDNYLKHVKRKQWSLEICHYGFGAYLYENRSLDWMRLYGNGFGRINPTSSIVNDYKEMFSLFYPFMEEEKTRNLLYFILNPQSKETGMPIEAKQFLIIEEINRGNCAQIFGDIFQLLDRQDNGFSTYPIEADTDMQQAIKTAFKEEDEYKLNGSINVEGAVEDYTSNYGKTLSEDIQEGRILLLPPNLFIWATMNTSDQSLFPIDSAFKRRWEWKYMKIVRPYKKNEDGSFKIENGEKIHFDYTIEGGHDWWAFLQQINAIIDKMTNSADKQLGYFFAKAKDDVISYDTFVSKVCFYLWNDIFKTYALDEQQSDLFSYIDNEGKKKQLTFPAFYDGDGNVIKEVAEAFIGNVMSWGTDTKNDKA